MLIIPDLTNQKTGVVMSGSPKRIRLVGGDSGKNIWYSNGRAFDVNFILCQLNTLES